MSKVWTESETDLLCDLYKKGKPVPTLARRFNVSEAAIRQRVSYYGIYRSREHLSAVRREASGLENVTPRQKPL